MEGFRLEDAIQNELKRLGTHYRRIKTRNSGFKGDNEIADFYVYSYPQLTYLEAKSVKGKSLPFSMIKPNQAIGLHNASKHKGIEAGFIIEFRELDAVYYVPISVMDERIRDNVKSFSSKFLTEHPDVTYIGNKKELNLTVIINRRK